MENDPGKKSKADIVAEYGDHQNDAIASGGEKFQAIFGTLFHSAQMQLSGNETIVLTGPEIADAFIAASNAATLGMEDGDTPMSS